MKKKRKEINHGVQVSAIFDNIIFNTPFLSFGYDFSILLE